MSIKIESNFADIANQLDQIIAELEAQQAAGLAKRFSVELTNVASTESKSGEKFFYFEAVNSGRKAVEGDPVIVYTDDSPDPIFTTGVPEAVGREITPQAAAHIDGSFPAVFDSIIETIAATGTAQPVSVEDTEIVPSLDAESKDNSVGTLNGLGLGQMQKPRGRDVRSLGVGANFKQKGAVFAKSRFVRALLNLTDWSKITGGFLFTVAKQVDHFRDSTPIRQTYKLVKMNQVGDNDWEAEVLPPPGGELRDGYAAVVIGDLD